jgi:hypothetical protein
VLHRPSLGLPAVALAFACLLAAPPALAAGPNVTVRVEGQNATLLAPTQVTLDPSTPVQLADATCPGDSAAAALDQATAGNWDRKQFTQTILGETHDFSNSDYWAEWVGTPAKPYAYGQNGICGDLMVDGGTLLMAYDVSTSSPPYITYFPIVLQGAPASAQRGNAFTVTVVRYDDQGNATPLAGATVAGGGTSATTDSAGQASLALPATGTASLQATAPNAVRSPHVSVCVHDGNDGTCGTTAPDGTTSSPLPPAAGPCVTTGDDGLCGTIDRTPALGQIKSIVEQERFARGKGPRTLAGIVNSDPSGLRAVDLRLTRNDRGRCSTFDGRRERLVRMRRCGAVRGQWFSAGSRTPWSYLLPARLPRGRYVLDVRTTDGAGNEDTKLQRTRDRVVFHVG